MSAGAVRRPVVLPGIGLSADELAQVAQLTHSQRYELNQGLDHQGATVQGTRGSITRSKKPPVPPALHETFALDDRSASGLSFRVLGRPSGAMAGCPSHVLWPRDPEQEKPTVYPLSFRVPVVVGYVPVLGLEDGWEAVMFSVPCSKIREHLLLLQGIELLEQHMQEQVQAA